MRYLVDFLSMRITEDQYFARAASSLRETLHGDAWAASPGRGGHSTVGSSDAPVCDAMSPMADHIARHDPLRALAECEAKLNILRKHSERITPEDGSPSRCDEDGHPLPCPTLRFLGTVYAEHPDYDSAWAV